MDIFEIGFPTEKLEILSWIKGNKIENIVRIIWEGEPLARTISDMEISNKEVFHMMDGPVVITFSNNVSIGVCSAYENLAVTAWLERDHNKAIWPNSIFLRKEVMMVTGANNSMFAENKFGDILGHTVKQVKYYKRDYKNMPWAKGNRRCEPAIGLELNSGKEVIFSQGFLTDGNGLEILFKGEIRADILEELEEIIIA